MILSFLTFKTYLVTKFARWEIFYDFFNVFYYKIFLIKKYSFINKNKVNKVSHRAGLSLSVVSPFHDNDGYSVGDQSKIPRIWCFMFLFK